MSLTGSKPDQMQVDDDQHSKVCNGVEGGPTYEPPYLVHNLNTYINFDDDQHPKA